MRSARIVALAVSTLVVALGAAALALLANRGATAKEQDLPKLYPVPEYEFTSASGEPFTTSQLDGNVWVVDMIFTSCAGLCPRMTTSMAGLAEQYAPEDGIRFVSVSVDPEVDTPQRLTEYGKQYGADFDEWIFLTGPMEEINALANDGLKLGGGELPAFHSDRFVLVDKEGVIRGYFHGTDDEDVAKLKKAIDRLLAE